MAINSMGINNFIDILSGKGYNYFPDEQLEKELKELLIGHSVKKLMNQL